MLSDAAQDITVKHDFPSSGMRPKRALAVTASNAHPLQYASSESTAIDLTWRSVFFFFCAQKLDGVNALFTASKSAKNRHCEWSTSGAPHWRADARRAWARRRTTRARSRAEERERARPVWRSHGNEQHDIDV